MFDSVERSEKRKFRASYANRTRCATWKKNIENQNGIASEELMFYLFNALPLDAIDSPNSLICIRRFIHSGGTYLFELQSHFVSKVNIWINNFGENLAECSSTKFASTVLEFFSTRLGKCDAQVSVIAVHEFWFISLFSETTFFFPVDECGTQTFPLLCINSKRVSPGTKID